MCPYHQLDLYDAVMSESLMPTFYAAIPFTLATIMHGRHIHMTCVWHVKGEGLCYGTLYEERIESVLELKQCFLLWHKAINIVICFGEMVSSA
jgi:hypothetical protein